MTLRLIREVPGEFHVGLWLTRHQLSRTVSIRLGWWAIVWTRWR